MKVKVHDIFLKYYIKLKLPYMLDLLCKSILNMFEILDKDCGEYLKYCTKLMTQ